MGDRLGDALRDRYDMDWDEINGTHYKEILLTTTSADTSVEEASNHIPLFTEEEWEEMMGDPIDEPTVELKCECGVWKVYGRTCDVRMHSNWCSMYQGEYKQCRYISMHVNTVQSFLKNAGPCQILLIHVIVQLVATEQSVLYQDLVAMKYGEITLLALPQVQL